MQKKLLILAVIVLILVGGGVLLWKKQNVQSPAQNQVITTENTDTDNVDTSDWKIYRNEKYGIEFKYPSNEKWKLEEVDYSGDSSSPYYPEKSINIFFSPESVSGRENADGRLTISLRDSRWGNGNTHLRNMSDPNIYAFNFNGQNAVANKPFNGEVQRDAVYNFFSLKRCEGTIVFGLPELSSPWEANETVTLFCNDENAVVFKAILDSVGFFQPKSGS